MIIDGKQIADEILAELKKEILDKNLNLSLGAVLVGDDPEFKKFVDLKGKVAEKAGIAFTTYKFPKEIKTDELEKSLREIIDWSDGVLVELPLPKHIDQQVVLNEIPVIKDVDVLSDDAQRLFYNNNSKITPPAVEALKIVLEKNHIDLSGKKAVVFGQGILVGKPISYWLEKQGVEVYRIRSTTENPEKLSLEADIVIAGVGKPGLITGEMVKEGAVVIDFGYGKKGGKMVGDVDLGAVSKKASLITPVPGGMGPILVAVVLKNLIKLNS
ncbi:MAG: bifunctional 5,10-methylenetetrahydrofolate dehydrogenase/5,10-methenyltetrahydrofolate cyclohydrolase [Candidatus Yanofskybacteria bacterium]|nr:bifunctional 5,10-methylenetetrahydrofolate dehydrogenase/5,10-methenyltetrahydrofolate cyclohydrolase [Candidatus Yanofskybacteria bacterium]